MSSVGSSEVYSCDTIVSSAFSKPHPSSSLQAANPPACQVCSCEHGGSFAPSPSAGGAIAGFDQYFTS